MELPQDMQGWLILMARIALPILVFFVTFGPKIDAWLSSWGPHYSREQLLCHGKALQGCEKPTALRNLSLVTAETAPALFQKAETFDRAKPKAKSKPREGRDRPSEKAETFDFDEPYEGKPSRPPDAASRKAPKAAEKEPASEEDVGALRRMHFESLVNFLAFNHWQPQRVFLPTGDPPPPPVRKHSGEAPELSGKDVLQANKEAQMVLHGAIEMDTTGPNPVLSGVARSLSDQLAAAAVDILSETYSLMVRACIKVLDLQSCSDFLFKMEAAGQALDGELLDQVMELYWSQKKQTQEPARPEQLSILPQHLRSAAEHYRPRQDSAPSTGPQPGSVQGGLQQALSARGLPMSHPPFATAPAFMSTAPYDPAGHSHAEMAFTHSQVPVLGPGVMPPQPVDAFNATSHLAPGGWGSMAAVSSMPPGGRARGANGDVSTGRRVDPDLPAFSVPEEFASSKATAGLSLDAPEFQPDAGAAELLEQMLALAKQGTGDARSSSGLSPEANEFQPGRFAADVREVPTADMSSSKAKGRKTHNKLLSDPCPDREDGGEDPSVPSVRGAADQRPVVLQ